MPEFTQYVDVDVEEFLDACTKRELEELVDILLEDGLLKITPNGLINIVKKFSNMTLIEEEWVEMCNELETLKHRMTNEDEDVLKSIINKYSSKKYF
jgi:hypothetical protein